ncbi:amino acid kinase family protein [Sansalvadorimonas verongulae]|uniref:amino acid kinase family protein n=1 Tax=Sansalvadorimonas verongulae TaxID=2172824 RepID=UPI0012BC5E7D|nr:carbamate kinase [Sansalvadorimonas verongulae]MTI13936.1 carbamate kinase [Sansalvadorimonas verongulae]
MLVVMALGANAIHPRGEPLDMLVQREYIRAAARSVASVAKQHQVVLTHSNGPQVGLLSLVNEGNEDVGSSLLGVLGAQTHSMLGFMLEQELRNEMPGRKVCTITTQTIVDSDDPAFKKPSQMVGSAYTFEEAQAVQSANPFWQLQQDGNYFRRVVASPSPREILELPSLRHIVSSGDITVICGGGGGIPVRRDCEGKLHGIEAVIDQDRATQVLAEGLEADALILLTETEAITTNAGQPDSRMIRECTPQALEALTFADISMTPKVESLCHFVRAGGKFGAIGALDSVQDILAGRSGTFVKVDVSDGITYYD